ncbi:hypothetical protein MMYC01_205229 [Madurella mycetomatis]|uniref:RING-type E3 ubiquitin transferase n=1 Tax=Madurella mycetomatis TaxID=100816 RepID=A0A175W796_9PEZI|nr:hypothetical protein MMYC01_205229 [Madurella mycetomatis]
MADQATRDQELMYCHACHHQWQRHGEGIECPACSSASTEIVREAPDRMILAPALTNSQVNAENDPRHFHNPPQGATATSSAPSVAQGAVQVSEAAPAGATERASPSFAQPQETSNSNEADGESRRPAPPNVPPHITFFTILTGQGPAPPAEVPPGMNVFGVRLFVPTFPFPPSSPAGNNTPPVGADTQPQQPQQQQSQPQPQPQSQPQQPGQSSQTNPPQPIPTIIPAGLFAGLLNSFFNPSAAVFGDAVFTQEALDRIIARLAEQSPPGGAPPASQSTLEKLQAQLRELDDKMLGGAGGNNEAKCAICVDDMAKGEKVAVLPCSHFFHGQCVVPWLKLHNTCPVCRRSVEEEKAGEGGKGIGSPSPSTPSQQAAPGPGTVGNEG